jgi:hypothetical protein
MLAGALACAAIQILPGLELVGHSIRAASNYSTSTEGTLHAPALMTLIAPDWLGALSGNYKGPPDITQYWTKPLRGIRVARPVERNKRELSNLAPALL